MFSKLQIALCSLVALLVIGVGIALGFEGFNQTITVGSAEFNGLRFTGSLEGLRLEVVLSSSSVKIGETLQMRVNLTGPKAWNVGLAKFMVQTPMEKRFTMYMLR